MEKRLVSDVVKQVLEGLKDIIVKPASHVVKDVVHPAGASGSQQGGEDPTAQEPPPEKSPPKSPPKEKIPSPVTSEASENKNEEEQVSEAETETADPSERAKLDAIEEAWIEFLKKNPNCNPEAFVYSEGRIVPRTEVQDIVGASYEPVPPPRRGRILRDDQFHPHLSLAPPPSDEYQLDLPLDPNARFFYIWHPSVEGLPSDMIDRELRGKNTKFYKKHEQFRSVVWLNRTITYVGRLKRRTFLSQPWFEFHIQRGANHPAMSSDVDFPDINPNDLFMIWSALGRSQSYSDARKVALVRVSKFLNTYLWDIFRHDAELGPKIAGNDWLRLIPDEIFEGIEERKCNITESPELGLIHRTSEGKRFIRASQAHRYSSARLSTVCTVLREKKKGNEDLRNQFIMRLEWWLLVRQWGEIVYQALHPEA